MEALDCYFTYRAKYYYAMFIGFGVSALLKISGGKSNLPE